MATDLKISEIRMDGETQPRSQIDTVTVTEYAEAMERGDKFPPVSVIYDGDDYWLYDGFHRVRAAEKRGEFQIRAEVEQGTREDAVWKSLAANKRHGLRRSQADKRRAIKRALKEWGQEYSDNRIAQHVGCDHKTVGKYRREIADDLGNSQVKERTGSDGRTIDISNIGSGSSTSDTDNSDPKAAEKESEMRPEGGTEPSRPVPDATPTSPSPTLSSSNRKGQSGSEPDLTPPREKPSEPKSADEVVDRICKRLAKIDVSPGATDSARFIEEIDKFTDDQRKRVARNLRSTAQRLWNRADKIDPATDS